MEDVCGGGVDGSSLASWAQTPPVHFPAAYPNPQEPPSPSPFPMDPQLNQAIVFWSVLTLFYLLLLILLLTY